MWTERLGSGAVALLCLVPAGCDRPRPGPRYHIAQKAPAPDLGPPAPRPRAPQPPPAAPPPPPDPLAGRFTLTDALAGLPGSGAPEAVLEIEAQGKPLGSLHCELFGAEAPRNVANFIGLARGLRPFLDPRTGAWVKRPLYDDMYVHRIVPEFMMQAGDPRCQGHKDCDGQAGTGSPGYQVPDEITPGQRFDRGGLLAMATRGPDTAGSQFFITEKATPWLSGHYTILGACHEPELVQQITALPRGEGDLPKQPILIKKVTIRRH